MHILGSLQIFALMWNIDCFWYLSDGSVGPTRGVRTRPTKEVVTTTMLEPSPNVITLPVSTGSLQNYCGAPGCRAPVPSDLASEGLCVMHLTFNMEQACARLRNEINQGTASPERRAEIGGYVVGLSVMLARVASSISLPDDKKKRVLNTFLTLMILRETLDRTTLARVARARETSTRAVLG